MLQATKINRHYNAIKKAYFKAYKECMQCPDLEARIFLTDNGMPYVSYYLADSQSWSQWEDENLTYLCTVNTMYWVYANDDMYKDGRPKVCKILREYAWDIERELSAHIYDVIKRYC